MSAKVLPFGKKVTEHPKVPNFPLLYRVALEGGLPKYTLHPNYTFHIQDAKSEPVLYMVPGVDDGTVLVRQFSVLKMAEGYALSIVDDHQFAEYARVHPTILETTKGFFVLKHFERQQGFPDGVLVYVKEGHDEGDPQDEFWAVFPNGNVSCDLEDLFTLL